MDGWFSKLLEFIVCLHLYLNLPNHFFKNGLLFESTPFQLCQTYTIWSGITEECLRKVWQNNMQTPNNPVCISSLSWDRRLRKHRVLCYFYDGILMFSLFFIRSVVTCSLILSPTINLIVQNHLHHIWIRYTTCFLLFIFVFIAQILFACICVDCIFVQSKKQFNDVLLNIFY